MKKTIQNQVHKLKTGWYIWLFPIFALMISGWLILNFYRQQGPRITILFDDASSIQPEKTRVRFRGVAIGTVKDITLAIDQKGVVAEVLLRKDAQHFAVEGSKFSLVTPKVGFQGVSGLETLFEGAYIAVLPGLIDGKTKTEFDAQSSSSTATLDDTSVYQLETNNVESVNPGDSVTFRGVKVGSVTKMNLTNGAQTILIQINIENRYSSLIRHNTVFWRKIGVHAKLGLFNSEIKLNSLDSIMNGGIELATPSPAAAMAKNQQKFTLAIAPPKDYAKWNPELN